MQTEKHMKKIFVILFLTFGTKGSSQADTSGKVKTDTTPVIVHKDPRLDMLVKKQAEINEVTGRDARKTDKGYRLLIISTNNRDEALAAKTTVYTYFPELKAYLWYQSPYFRVKAGNFKERKDAESYQRRLNSYFQKGVFIMKDVIEVKKGKGINDEAED